MDMEIELFLSLIAVILAALAFIVAFLQVILEYTTSSPWRNMCSQGAIGPSAKERKLGWAFRRWKLKVYYPLLSLKFEDLLLRFLVSDVGTIEKSPVLRNICDRRGWGWRPVRSSEKITWRTVAGDSSVMARVDKQRRESIPVTTADLDWVEFAQFLWYRLFHPLRRMQRPRASWAQIIVALGIKDTSNLTYHRADAESIPANLDTPIQRIGLRHLGMLAFVMGFHTVELDIPKRNFRAYSPMGTIETQDSDVVVRVLRFEGDILAIHELISRCDTAWVWRAADLVPGMLSFGKYLVLNAFLPLKTLARAIAENTPVTVYRENRLQAIRVGGMGFSTGPVYLEAMLMRRYLMMLANQLSDRARREADAERKTGDCTGSRNPCARAYLGPNGQLRDLVMRPTRGSLNLTGSFEGCAARWQSKTGSQMPTIYVAACFTNIHGVVCGFPSRSLLLPFIPWVRRRAHLLLTKKPSCALVSSNLSRAMTKGSLPFARETSNYLMSTHVGASQLGTYGWGITRMHDLYKSMPEDVQRDVVPNENVWEVNAVLIPETVRLLKNFNIDAWAASILEANQTLLISFNAVNCLWIQIIVLDVAIQFFLHGHWGFEPMENPRDAEAAAAFVRMLRSGTPADKGTPGPQYDPYYFESWGREEAAVVQGIVRAWRQPGLLETDDEIALDQARNSDQLGGDDGDLEGTPDWQQLGLELRDWDLGEALIAERAIQFGDQGAPNAPSNRNAMRRRLAELLELRAVFVFAFLLMHPDSSDIYDSARKEEDIEMPMV